jgi:hypothetical protein
LSRHLAGKIYPGWWTTFRGQLHSVPEQPVDFWETAEQRPRADVVADLTGGDEQVERASLAVANGMQLGVHAALGSTYQATAPPFVGQLIHWINS